MLLLPVFLNYKKERTIPYRLPFPFLLTTKEEVAAAKEEIEAIKAEKKASLLDFSESEQRSNVLFIWAYKKTK
ncbi:hypothetical protein BOY45_004078 [Shigella flexneri]|nr:hypothetical protein [Shigella flexneri]